MERLGAVIDRRFALPSVIGMELSPRDLRADVLNRAGERACATGQTVAIICCGVVLGRFHPDGSFTITGDDQEVKAL